MTAAQAAAAATVGLLILAAGQFALLRRQARREEVLLLAQLIERWNSLQSDWERLILIARGPSSYYLISPTDDTARYRDLLAARLDEARTPGDHSRWLTVSHELHIYRRAAEACLRFFATTCLLVLNARLTSELLYAVFGTELPRNSGAIRALLDYPDQDPDSLGFDLTDFTGAGDSPDQAAMRAEETMRFIARDWVGYQPGIRERVLILIDILWAEAAKREDLNGRDLILAAEVKRKLQTGARNRRRVRRAAARGGHPIRGLKLSRLLRSSEFRRRLRRTGVVAPPELLAEIRPSVLSAEELQALRARLRDQG